MCGLPAMLADVVDRLISREPDMAVVGRVDPTDAERAVTAWGARVIVAVLADGALPAPVTRVLRRMPEVTVLAITEDGDRAYRYELRPHAVPLGEVSTHMLVDVIRTAEAGDTRP